MRIGEVEDHPRTPNPGLLVERILADVSKDCTGSLTSAMSHQGSRIDSDFEPKLGYRSLAVNVLVVNIERIRFINPVRWTSIFLGFSDLFDSCIF
jgi:hypothetical protein